MLVLEGAEAAADRLEIRAHQREFGTRATGTGFSGSLELMDAEILEKLANQARALDARYPGSLVLVTPPAAPQAPARQRVNEMPWTDASSFIKGIKEHNERQFQQMR
jgi:hypothetical protein